MKQRMIKRYGRLCFEYINPAPAILPLFRASASAILSTIGPLAVFIRIEFSFINAILSRDINPWVSSVNGRCNDTISLL